jgi:replication factor A1
MGDIMNLKIKDIKDGTKQIDLPLVVVMKAEKKNVRLKDGSNHVVSELTIADESGTIKLALWDTNLNIDVGTKLEIKNAYTRNFRGNVELSIGKFGTAKVL